MGTSVLAEKRISGVVIRYATVIFMAATVAVGVSAVAPEKVEAANTVTVTTCTGGTIDLSAAEKQMLDLHNKTRADNKLPKFCVHPTLTRAARAHSEEMIDKDYFSHNSYNRETFSARLKRFGYSYRTAGENIAWGSGSYSTPENRFKAWMNSPGHKANILNKKFREIGIGSHTGNYRVTNGVTMWTADFGTR